MAASRIASISSLMRSIILRAKLVSTEVVLRDCQNIFQICGARSALAAKDFDRFWRNVRTLAFHDPKDYKAELIGEYFLQGKYPPMGGYS
jgi:alkylation response protein AidB-like acyl-CoA dehydrogenase